MKIKHMVNIHSSKSNQVGKKGQSAVIQRPLPYLQLQRSGANSLGNPGGQTTAPVTSTATLTRMCVWTPWPQLWASSPWEWWRHLQWKEESWEKPDQHLVWNKLDEGSMPGVLFISKQNHVEVAMKVRRHRDWVLECCTPYPVPLAHPAAFLSNLVEDKEGGRGIVGGTTKWFVLFWGWCKLVGAVDLPQVKDISP